MELQMPIINRCKIVSHRTPSIANRTTNTYHHNLLQRAPSCRSHDLALLISRGATFYLQLFQLRHVARELANETSPPDAPLARFDIALFIGLHLALMGVI
jgi:hypothetical protein